MRRVIFCIFCVLLCTQVLIISLHTPMNDVPQNNDSVESTDVFLNAQEYLKNSILDTLFIESEHSATAIDIVLYQNRSAYICARVSSGMPTKNAYQDSPNGNFEMYLAKIDVVSHELLWGTYFGGSSVDFVQGIDTDIAGNLYVLGWTESLDFPIQSAAQATYGGTRDATVSKFTPDGDLVFSTYFGGIMTEESYGIATSDSGEVYITGTTYSEDFPTTSGLDGILGGERDAFMVKLASDGSVIWSTMLGSDADEVGYAIAIDKDGLPYLCGYTGWTPTSTFPLIDPIDSVIESNEGFIVQFNTTGHLIYSTYMGGDEWDIPSEIIVTDNDEIVLTGVTSSTDFPTINSFQDNLRGYLDAFIVKFNKTTIIYSSYFGGPGYESDSSIALDSNGDCYFSFNTQGNITTLVDPIDSDWDVSEAVIAKVNSSGGLIFSSYLGGSESDYIGRIATDQDGDCYVLGSTDSLDFPVENENSIKTNSIYEIVLTRIGNDTIVPVINSPEDLEFYEGELGNQIVWSPYDKNPNSYNVTMNDILYAGNWWNTSEDVFALNVDSLEAGTYLFEISVFDIVHQYASDTVIVNVVPQPKLELSNALDFNYTVGSLENTITWTLISGNPDSFTILRNNIVLIHSGWTDEEITLDVNYLPEGDYNFTLVIFSGSEYTSDSVIVRVQGTSGTPDEWNPVQDIGTIAIIGSALVLAIVAISFLRKPSKIGY